MKIKDLRDVVACRISICCLGSDVELFNGYFDELPLIMDKCEVLALFTYDNALRINVFKGEVAKCQN